MLLDRNDAGVSGVLSSQSLEHGVESCCMNRGASISLRMRLQLPVLVLGLDVYSLHAP